VLCRPKFPKGKFVLEEGAIVTKGAIERNYYRGGGKQTKDAEQGGDAMLVVLLLAMVRLEFEN